ncbi:MAG: hypothetical protein AB7H80_03505 [Candidatus Kapaibacterium sp.]
MSLRFLKPVLILTLILAALLAYPVIAWFPDTRSAIYAAWGIALANSLIGMTIIQFTLDKENFIFMASFFGGMGLRIMITLMVFAFLLSEDFDAKTLTFFMLGLYFVYLIQEIHFLVKTMSKQKGQAVYRKR